MKFLEKTTADANKLFDLMQRVVEDRQKPIMESYQKDFYKLDKDILAEHFAENSRLLWLLHPCGSHLGRIGVLPDDKDMMKAVLNSYINSYEPERMELNEIKINANGEANIRKISFQQGHDLIAKKDYTMSGNSLMQGSNKIATIDVKISGQGGQYHGHTKITSINGHASLSREQSLAAVMISSSLTASQSGSLFTAIKSIEIDGRDLYAEMPALDIADLIVGKYFPAVAEAETSAYTTPRPRA